MNRQCSFGQTNNPLENIFETQEEISHDEQSTNQNFVQAQQQSQNNFEQKFNSNQVNGKTFQQPFNYEWNLALTGNGIVQKDIPVESNDQVQNIFNQYQAKTHSDEQTLTQQHINLNNQQNFKINQQCAQGNQQTLQIAKSNNIIEFQRLQELDYKRIQTEESSNDSIIYKGEEVDKILSRYSFQVQQENQDFVKLHDNNLQNTPGSLSYSVNDLKSCQDNILYQSGVTCEQDLSINFNLKPPLNNYNYVQSFNEKAFNSNFSQNFNKNQQGVNLLSNQQGINQISNSNNIANINQSAIQAIPAQQNIVYNNQFQGGSGTSGNNINVQENLNLSKSDLFSNNQSGIKWSLMSQSSGMYFPFSNNTASNISGLNTQKQISSLNIFPSSTTSNQQQKIQIPQTCSQQLNSTINQLNNNQNLNFQKQNLDQIKQITNNLSEQNNKCQECTLNKQQIDLLQIQLKESQEREETQQKLYDSLLMTLNQVKEDQIQKQISENSDSKSEILKQHYEKEISQLREQMKSKQKQQELVSKELILRYDELDEKRYQLEHQVQDLKKRIEFQSIEKNEALCNLSKKDYQIFQLNEEINKLQKQNQSTNINQVQNLEIKLEQMQKNHENEIKQLILESENEGQKAKNLLNRTIESFEIKIRTLMGENNQLEKTRASSNEKSNNIFQKLSNEVAQLKQQKGAALKQIDVQQKTIELQKVQATGKQTLLSQIEEQERTIEHLQGISLAHDSLLVQYAQQASNIKNLQLKIKKLNQEILELKSNKDNDFKDSSSKYVELTTKLNEQQINNEKMKKDFSRKSSMIIREILNKDVKIRQLSEKLQIMQNNSTPFTPSNASNIQLGSHHKQDRSHLSNNLNGEKTLSDNHNIIEFNKSQQFLNSPPQQENVTSAILINGKSSHHLENEKGNECLQSRTRSPTSRRNCNTQQFWQNFMDLSNSSNDNILFGIQNQYITGGEDDEENIMNLNISNIGNHPNDDLKNKYQSLLYQRNILEDTINDLKLQLNKKNELEICLKNEIKFVVEHLIQNLADQIVIDIRDNENITIQGNTSSQPSGLLNQQKKQSLNGEERIMRETDKILKQYIMKLQQEAISSQMIECYNILNSILGQDNTQTKQQQILQEKQPLMPSQKSRSVNKLQSSSLQQSNQEQVSSSTSLPKRGKQQNTEKLHSSSKSNSPFSQSLQLQQQSSLQATSNYSNENSSSVTQLKLKQKQILRNNTFLNTNNTNNSISPTRFKKPGQKLSDIKIDKNQEQKKQKLSSSPMNKKSQQTPTRAQNMQKFGNFFLKQTVQNTSTQSNGRLKTQESSLSQNVSNYNSNFY